MKIQDIFIQFMIIFSNKTQNDFVSNDFVFTSDIAFIFDIVFAFDFVSDRVFIFDSGSLSTKQKFKYKRLFK